MMGGYKTWIAVAGAILLGIYRLMEGEVQEAMTLFTFALGLLGIGSKIEKNKK